MKKRDLENIRKATILLKEQTDFTKLPQGMRVYDGIDFLTANALAEARKDFDDYVMFDDVTFKKELGEIVTTLKRLNIDVSFNALVDERYDGEHNDGLYNWDEQSGIAVNLKMGDIDRTLYFVITSRGAWTEDGGRPEVYVPRVLEDEETFISVLLQSLNIGGGPKKNAASSIKREEQEAYADWWWSLSREEREDPDSKWRPPNI
jgi:hypothetical protein